MMSSPNTLECDKERVLSYVVYCTKLLCLLIFAELQESLFVCNAGTCKYPVVGVGKQKKLSRGN